MTEKTLSERITDLEDKINYLIYKEKTQVNLSEVDFRAFYKRVENEAKKQGWTAYCIWLDRHFEKDLKHKVLYPDYDTGYWYPIGKTTKDAPVAFEEMKNDFLIESYAAGDFRPKGKEKV